MINGTTIQRESLHRLAVIDGGRAKPAEPPALDFGLLKIRSRQAQSQFALEELGQRRRKLERLRTALVEKSDLLAELVSRHRHCTVAEAFATEIIPLADALKYNAKRFARLLAPKRLGATDRPGWLAGVDCEVRRQPLGLILIIAPGNYPLYLAGVQAVQAVAAGNAVWLKPAPGAAQLLTAFGELFVQAGFAPGLVQILPDTVQAAQGALDAGSDKVIFTGSAETGRHILARLAPRLTPSVMELSGCDAVFLRHDADLQLSARAIAFGLSINRGATCIAPRRIFVPRQHLAAFTQQLRDTLKVVQPIELDTQACHRWLPWVKAALAEGAYVVAGTLHSHRVTGPLVLSGVLPDTKLMQEDTFASVASIAAVDDDDDAITANARCAYALSASVFGRNQFEACRLADRIHAGSVVINDLIVPTADPRVPFGGLGQSGFGVTRGAEGLLELTAPKVVITNAARQRLHYRTFGEADAPLFRTLLQLSHGASVWQRLRALFGAIKQFRSSTSGGTHS